MSLSEQFGQNCVWIFLNFISLCLYADTQRLFQYDKQNQLITETTADGQSISYEYDFAGRLLKENMPDGTVHYLYDKNGNCTQMSDKHGITTYQYNGFNQLMTIIM